MGMTLTEKILAKAAGQEEVHAGQFVVAKVRTIGVMEALMKNCLETFGKLGIDKIPNPDQVVMVYDHYIPTPTVKYANDQKEARALAHQYGVKNLYDVGRGGIMHQILHEQGHIIPGTLAIAAESHTPTSGAVGAVVVGVGMTETAMTMATGDLWLRVPATIKVNFTGKLKPGISGKDVILHLLGVLGFEKKAVYRAVEFGGEGVAQLPMDYRLTITNMCSDMGAKNAIFPVDAITREYLKDSVKEEYEDLRSDDDAVYEEVYTVDLGEIDYQIACPPDVDNTVALKTLEKIPVDQAFVGSCTNGRMSDMREVAAVVKGRKVHPNVRFLIAPASQAVLKQCVKEGIVETFIDAGIMLEAPTCGPCFGSQNGLIGDGEVAITASNRNWVGRMGSKLAKVYLGSPAVVAASAIAGYICAPEDLD